MDPEIKNKSKYYIENTDETCPNCGGQIWTVDLDEINAECIDCKARFVLKECDE